jgi:hypothetical protein
MALFLAIAVWLLGICSVAPVKAAGEAWRGELDQAIELAVAGDLDGSLVILARLEGEHPDEPDIVRRTAQVLARSGKTAKASERFQRLKQLSPDTFTDREQLLVLLLSVGAVERYEKERQELLAAVKAAGDRQVTRSPSFVRELFVVDKRIKVDAFEFYPNSRDGTVTPYYFFISTGSDGELKGQFLMAADSEKTAKLKKNGKIAESDGGYYLELQPAPQSAEGAEGQLIALLRGALFEGREARPLFQPGSVRAKPARTIRGHLQSPPTPRASGPKRPRSFAESSKSGHSAARGQRLMLKCDGDMLFSASGIPHTIFKMVWGWLVWAANTRHGS